MYNRVQTLSANTNTGDTMHHHTFVHRRPAHMIELFGNLFNPSPPTPSWSLVTNPDPTAQAKLRTNRNEYALATSCTPDPDDNAYRTAAHPARTLGITRLEAVDTDYTVFQITLPTDEAIGATRIIDAIAADHNTSRATAFTELLHGTAGEVKVTLNCYRNLDTGDMHLENHKLTGIAPDTWMRRVTDLTVPSHSTPTTAASPPKPRKHSSPVSTAPAAHPAATTPPPPQTPTTSTATTTTRTPAPAR